MSSILSGLSKGFTSLKNTLGLGNTKRRNNKNKNKGAATPPPANATPPAPPAETPAGTPAPPPGPSQSAGKMMRAANLRYLKFYKPKKSTRRKGKKSKKGTRRR
jgi:hypothetical protein